MPAQHGALGGHWLVSTLEKIIELLVELEFIPHGDNDRDGITSS